MKILVTGARGFIGKNLVEALKNIRDEKDRSRPKLKIDEIFEFSRENTLDELRSFVRRADFVIHLAGVNRPKNEEDFTLGNVDFSKTLINILKEEKSTAKIVVTSSLQATLSGRYAGSIYGESKKRAEELFFNYEKETGNETFIYRLPNVFGKWCKPNYNSAIATFCYNISRNLDIVVNDETTILQLVYIDDVVAEILNALEDCANKTSSFSEVQPVYEVSLLEIVTLLKSFKEQRNTLVMPSIPENSFAKKLYSTYLSYLPAEKVTKELKMNVDARGSFTEILKTLTHGQFSVNISKPNITKGEHWHNSKWEIFIVVSGEGLIQQRRIGVDENGVPYPIINTKVSGEKIEAVYILPGYTHNIINLSNDKDLVTLMWVNEVFDKKHPETYFEKVENENGK